MKRILLLILVPIAAMVSVISIVIILLVSQYQERDIQDHLSLSAYNTARDLEQKMSVNEAYINSLALLIGLQFNDINYEKEGDQYLKDFRNSIAPAVFHTALQIEDCKGVYFMFHEDMGDRPSQVWFNGSDETGRYERIFEYPDREDYSRSNSQMDYYYTPLDTGKIFWSNPYIDSDTDVPMFSYVVPVFHNEKVIGVAGMDITMETIMEYFSNIRFLETGYALLLNSIGEIIYHPLFSFQTPIDKVLGDEMDFLTEELLYGGKQNTVSYRFLDDEKRLAYYRMSNQWVLAVTAFDEEIFKPVRDLQQVLIFISALIILLTAAISYLSARYISRPIIQLTEDVGKSINHINFILDNRQLLSRQDELGDLAREFRELQIAFNETLKRMIESNISLERMAQLGNQVGAFTHEIKSPFGVVLTSLSYGQDLLLEMKEKMVNEKLSKQEFKKYVDDINQSMVLALRNIDHAKSIINNLKSISVPQAHIHDEKINMTELLKEIFSGIILQHKGKEIIFHNDTDECPSFISQRGYIIQIFTNLINNSIIHGFENREKGIIEIGYRIENKHLVFDYSDNGSGIPDHHVDKIFDPYFTSAQERGGTGLGLHIISTILKTYLNGSIEFFKKGTAGVLFRIKLPYRLL